MKIKSLVTFVICGIVLVSGCQKNKSLSKENLADINAKFIDAATRGDVEQVKVLLEKGVDVNSQINPHTQLKEAFFYKAEINNGATALMMASQNGHTEVVNVLLDAKANVNIINDGLTALIVAIQEGHFDIVKILLEANADVNLKGSYIFSGTALSKAVSKHNTKIVKALLEAGADVNENAGLLGSASLKGDTDIVKALLDAKMDVNFKNPYGTTALMNAAVIGHTDIVKVLLDAKADTNIKNNEGQTALMIAEEKGHSDIVNLLKQYGAKE